MGRIRQAAFDIKVPIHDRISLNITQWKYIGVYEAESRIDVCLKTRVTCIEGITLDEFNAINSKNQTAEYRYQYKCTHLPCSRCGGKGVIDWVDRALVNRVRTPEDYVDKYIRNKTGPVNTYVRGFNAEIMYSSTPKLKKGEEFCLECFGCGIKMPKSKLEGQTFFK